jgi:hypothetical protein
MRGGAMININDYKEFANNLSTLMETSIDPNKTGDERYMTLSKVGVVNFDSVKKEYVQGLGLSDEPKSNDALYISSNGKVVFIEFKNGYIDNTKQFAIRKKIYDSVLIFTDIVEYRISKMRKFIDYVLVINEKVNPDVSTKLKSFVQPSESYDEIAKQTSRYAKGKYIPFGLRMFENYCFQNVDVFSKQEFEMYITNELTV